MMELAGAAASRYDVAMLDDLQRKRAFTIIILTQCLGMLNFFLFQNGFYLNYFTKLGFSSATFAWLASLPSLLSGFLLLPFAFISDRVGKMKLALAGQIVIVAGMLFMMMAGWGFEHLALPLATMSLLLYCLGGSIQGSNWFALLNPIIPKEIRGRFFGRLRVTFMTVNVLFTMLITAILKYTQSMAAFQVLLSVVFVAHVLRYFTYAQIPELEREVPHHTEKPSFRKALHGIFAMPGYLQFSGYVFLLTLFTGGVPIVFGLMQKDVFGFSESGIMLVGNFYLAGSIAGCWLGGRLVDKLGTRFVLLCAHVVYGAAVLGMIARHWAPWSTMTHAVICSACFSIVGAVAGVAITSEVLALIPATHKSLSTAVHMALINWGAALAGLFVSRTVAWHLFASEWRMLGQTFSSYDAILLIFGILVLVLLAAIGLVPTVVKKVQWLPGSGYPRV